MPSSNLALFETQRSSSSDGCILGVLRRILCARTILSDTCSRSDANANVDDQGVTVPGLVARLIGLDSIPEQSRKLHLHRRSKSSRETSTYIQLENDDDQFIVLTFDNRKKSPANNRQLENIAASPESTHQQPNVLVAMQQQSAEIQRIKNHIRLVQNTIQRTDSKTDDSSPVSIFDFQEHTSCLHLLHSSDDDSWTRSSSSSSSSSRLSSPEQDNSKISTRLELSAEDAVESIHKAAILNNNNNNNNNVVHVNGQKKKIEVWDRVSNITFADIRGEADAYWHVKQDLAAEFEVHIMDYLLNDLLCFCCIQFE